MIKLKAKTILKDKFWIIENDGNKVASLQRSDIGYTVIQDKCREQFATQKELKTKYNIVFDSGKSKVKEKSKAVYDFPCKTEPFNDMYDVKNKLPIFTKNEKSKSFYCAGYYAIKFDSWMPSFCPKLLTLTRNDFLGPFKSRIEMNEVIKKHNDQRC